MPTAYVKKVASKHGTTVEKTEGKWKAAKKAAAKEGHKDNYAYVTGIFKKMAHENQYPTFKGFLIMEADVESTPGQSLDTELSPVQQADDLAGMDPDAEAAGEPLDLDSDERFLDLSPVEQRRIRIFSRNMSPPEVEEELQSTWERTSGSQGGTFGTDAEAGLDGDMDAGMEAGADDEFADPEQEVADGEMDNADEDDFQMADNVTAMPKPMAPMPRSGARMRGVGESFLASLLK